MHSLYEEANRAYEYQMELGSRKVDVLNIVCLIVEMLEMHFDRNS